ncbi:Protein of unknown function [Leuconostoc citreum LBAE C11]|nr:Protein of unknown function [Leuconostoc citreum LBAE C11]
MAAEKTVLDFQNWNGH